MITQSSAEASSEQKAFRAQSVKVNIRLVKIIAYQVAAGLPRHIDVDDLISAGMVGLITAVDRFDEARGVRFNTYASIRIRGAIIDELRSMDWVTRSMRDKLNRVDRACAAAEQAVGRPAEAEDIAGALGISVEDASCLMSEARGRSMLSIEDLGIASRKEAASMIECMEDPKAVDPMAALRLNQLKRAVRQAIETLTEKEKTVVALYYYDEMTLKEIGGVLGITESRVCQLHGRIMRRLKLRLRFC